MIHERTHTRTCDTTCIQEARTKDLLQQLFVTPSLACSGCGVMCKKLILKIYPKKMMDWLVSRKRWRLEDAPRKLIQRILTKTERSKDAELLPPDSLGLHLTFERRCAKSIHLCISASLHLCIHIHRHEDTHTHAHTLANTHTHKHTHTRKHTRTHREVMYAVSTSSDVCFVCGLERGTTTPGGSRVVLLRCGRCNKVTYCGTECQRRDWASHKESCLKLMSEKSTFIMQSDVLGGLMGW